MARVYQAVLRDRADRLGPRLRRAFLTWLALPDDDGDADLELNVGGTRIRLHDGESCGRYVAEPPDLLTTTITWARTQGDRRNWATITVDSPDDAHPDLVAAPAFVPDFLATARADDGVVPLEATAHEFDVTNTDELLGWLTSPARRVPIVVLTPDARDPQAMTANAALLAEALAGVALIARLRDHPAQVKMNAALGESLEVFGGGLRTYLPDLRPGAESYPHRHQVRSGGALRDHGPRALDVVISGVTRESVRRALPDDIRTAARSVTGVLTGKLSPEALWTAPRLTHSPLRDHLAALAVDPRVLARAANHVATQPEPPRAPANASPPEPSLVKPGLVEPGLVEPGLVEPGLVEPGLVEPGLVEPGLVEPAPVAARDETPEAELSTPDLRPAAHDLDLTVLADRVATRVADELRGEILAALEMAGGDRTAAGSETLRSIHKMSAHMEALRRELDQTRLLQQTSANLQAEAEGQTAALEVEFARLRQDHDQLELDYEELAGDERRARERIRWLEGRLAELSEPVYGMATPEQIWEPESLWDVLQRARAELTRLDLPASLDTDAAKLDVTHPRHCRVWAGKAWDALRALNAYAATRAAGLFNGGFRLWCDQPPPGQPSITKHMVTMRESETVSGNGALRAERTFPVPATLDPSGEIFMEAHIKLQRVGYPAPRMYFHDDAGGPTATVWIGYLGDHLNNTRTN
ncbi:hypothetical protein ACFXJ8_30565 [Nonomuraea sp. NPDC059194]|uniref:hypothetical protein n=1 Tax=Nonomuraea sp. NPDC059194 TaxID=3346764 RepID=UPI00369DA28E